MNTNTNPKAAIYDVSSFRQYWAGHDTPSHEIPFKSSIYIIGVVKHCTGVFTMSSAYVPYI